MLLEVERVSKSYPGLPVLHDVSLTAADGEIVCILGPSGCGKSTLLRIIAGLETADAGRVLFDGSTQVDPLTLVTLIQTSPQHYRLDGSDTLRFEFAMETAEQRFERVETLLNTLNQKVAKA